MNLLEAKHIIKSMIAEQVDHYGGCEAIDVIGKMLQKMPEPYNPKVWNEMKPAIHKAMIKNGCINSQQPSTTSDEMYINPECTEEEIEAGADGCFSATGHFTDIDHDCPGCPQQE